MSDKGLDLPIPLDELKRLLRQHGVVRASVFGSYARGEATPSSDLDLMVELAPGRSYFDLGGLQYELEKKLGLDVDVVLASTVRKRMRPYIEQEKVGIEL
jgi:predicted nucleotidyltransferase